MLSIKISFFKTTENKIYDKKIVVNVKKKNLQNGQKEKKKKNLGRASFGG